jgi:cytochrome c oxidase cbb3-type subunit 3
LYRVTFSVSAFLVLGAAILVAQQTEVPPPPTAPPTDDYSRSYPGKTQGDPAAIQRGKQIFSANCSFCHGSDARGGEGGPNLIRSQTVMDDQKGEAIAVVVQNGRPDRGMPKFDLTTEQIADIAAFLHSIPVGGRAATTGLVDPLVGNAQAGEAYFNGAGKCNTCHSITGDLAGVGSRYVDARALEGAIVSGEGRLKSGPGKYPWKTVIVTLPSGQTITGRLNHVDDFTVGLWDADGNYHSYQRNGDSPKVVVTDPMQPHRDMLHTWKDDDMHNLTAYLVTIQ